VTVVGMDNAIVDIVSIVTILQDREIGIHDGNAVLSLSRMNFILIHVISCRDI
ncbi:hypothetical protein EDC96DRAFT_438650, partial [Choanephora cucurbitarum]